VDLNDTPEQAEYRTKVRAWLEQHRDDAPARNGDNGDEASEAEAVEAHRAWQRKLAEAGFVGATWPREYGGQGLGPLEQVVVNQEVARAGLPGILDSIGVGMLGPTIIAHGSEEQKQRYLAPMLHADEVWCQLFSEPAAGSDLAGIQARAKREDDGSWRLSGQKVWTTNAQFAAFGLLLARTDPDVTKHKGLTMFIVPMDAEGVTIRGLRQISGEAEFNEVFFDDVRLDPDADVRTPDDRRRLGGHGIPRGPLRRRDRRRRGCLPGPRGARPAGRYRDRAARRALQRLPHPDRDPAWTDPWAGSRPWKGDPCLGRD